MWATRFRLRQGVVTSLWLLPLLCGLFGTVLGSAGLLIAKEVVLPPYWQYTPSAANTVLTAIVSASAALLGFVVTVSVLGVQMTTGTFSARHTQLASQVGESATNGETHEWNDRSTPSPRGRGRGWALPVDWIVLSSPAAGSTGGVRTPPITRLALGSGANGH